MWLRRWLVVSLALALFACGEARSEEPAALDRPVAPAVAPGIVEPGIVEPVEAVPVEAVPAGTASDPAPEPLLDQLGEAPSAAEEAAADAMPQPLVDHPPPPRGCALQIDAPLRVLASAGPPAILASGDGFIVAAYDARGVSLVRARPGALPRPLGSIALEGGARGAAPALAVTGEHEVTIAMIDARGRVLEASFDPSLAAIAATPRVIAEAGADARFAPAVRAVGTRRVVAWTDGAATPMRLRLAILDARRVVATHDVTPIAGGGAAPSFVEGSDEPLLYFLDPRVGISVAHRVVLDGEGAPGPTEVARPLNLAAEPPAIAAARAGGRTWLAYAAVGNMATRAVGLVSASGTDAPTPLVAGLGYGAPLTLDAVSSGAAVVFAAEAPSGASVETPHEIRIRRVDAEGAGEALVLSAPATDPAIARGENGLLAIAHRTSGAGVVVRFARCAD